MPQQIRLWTTKENDNLHPLRQGHLDFEDRLENWIENDIGLVDESILVIGRQVKTDYGGFIDLLAIDSNGDLIILELKRDKTPRDITAQALDYASWVVDLSHNRITSIANDYLDSNSLEEAFREKYGEELPESLNNDHRLLIVTSNVDPSTERIIEYLSRHHGVNINAVTFQYFALPDSESELLARVFLLEPEAVEYKSRTKGTSKRKPNLTREQLEEAAAENGVGELYGALVRELQSLFHSHKTTRSSISFVDELDGGRRAMFNLIPAESTPEEGLRYQVYSYRIADKFGLDETTVRELLPASAKDWEYIDRGNEWKGYAGSVLDYDELAPLINELNRISELD